MGRSIESNKNEWVYNIPDTIDGFHLHIIDWFVDDDDYYGIGINVETKRLEKFKVKNINSGLYVWAHDIDTIKDLLVNINDCDVTHVNCDKLYFNNNTSVIDDILDNGRYGQNWKLFKIKTKTFVESSILYYQISKNVGFSYKIATLGIWNISVFMMLEFHRQNKNQIYGTMINNMLDYGINTEFNIPTVVFDIETVSNYDHRIPMGTYHSDHIMSITIIIEDEIITIFNLPVEDENELNAAKTIIDSINVNDYYKMKSRKTFIYHSEIDLLNHVFRIFNSLDFAYVCLGYNSRGYDMPFLLARAVYLNMPQIKDFYYMNGILSYGINMIHIDLHQVLVKYFEKELSSYTLKNVAKKLLDDTSTQKVDFNARNLRYIYKYIYEHNHINNGKYDNILCDQQNTWGITLDIMAKYNEMDCLVVLALWDKLQYESFLKYASRVFFLPFTRVAVSLNNEYLSTNMIYECLQRCMIFTEHSHLQFAKNNNIMFSQDIDIVAASDLEAKSFNGAFNERKKRGYYSTVYAMDARAYYPELISGENISHETVSLMRISDLKILVKECKYKDFDHEYKIIKFCTHKQLNDVYCDVNKNVKEIIDSIASAAYVHNFVDNCTTIKFENLHHYNEKDKIIIIKKTRRGILSKIIEERNILRNIAKANKKIIERHIETCGDLLGQYELQNAIGDNDEEKEISYSDDEEEDILYSDDDDMTPTTYSYDMCKIQRAVGEEESIYLVKPQLKILTKKEFDKFDSKIEALKKYIEHLQHEYTRINSHYRNMKLLNNSIYGLLGANYGIFRAKNIAAIVTMMGRQFIIESALIGNKINGNMIYSDTDSVFFELDNCLVKNPADYIVNQVQKLNSHVILNSKIYKHMFIMSKKMYIATHNDMIFSRGIDKNGPALWKFMLDKFYTRFIVNKEHLDFEGVYDVLYDMYDETYEKIKNSREQLLQTVNIKERSDYKMTTAITKLYDRITIEMPHYKFDRKVSCFKKIPNDDINILHLALDIELDDTPLHNLNIYKFYSGIISYLYLILSYAIKQTTLTVHDYIIKYKMSDFKNTNKIAFKNVLEKYRKYK